jgi:chromosome segregation ATPase
MSDQKYKPLSEMADQIVRLTNKGDELEARLDGYRVTNDTLRASLHDLQKRHEEAKLSLEVALEKIVEMAFKNREQGGHEAGKLQSDRDAALIQAARLREALKLLLGSCIYDDGELTVPSRYVVHGATAALATPGPSLAEIKAEALEEAVADLKSFFSPHEAVELAWTRLIDRATLLRGGEK